MLLAEQLFNNHTFAIWQIEESEAYFRERLTISESDEIRIEKYRPNRRLEWLAGRWLLRVLHKNSEQGACEIDEYGKPFCPASPYYVSISHSKNRAAAIVSKTSSGIDIQIITSKIGRIAHKFLRVVETSSIQDKNRLEHLHIYWGAKEALYKAYGLKKLDFRKHVLVEPFDYQAKGQIKGQVIKGDFKARYDLFYEVKEGYVLVYAIEE